MLARLLEIWTRYRDADRRQLPLFPDWERARWLMPLPSVVAAVGLLVLFAVGTQSTAEPERVAALAEPAEESEEVEAPEYDLAAIPDHIKAAAQRHRLPESLITAVISVESGFDHAAVSSKGARGLMQLMPQTSAMMGVRDPHSPDENIDAGASHLRAMLDTFKGDLPLALAAYNAGEQNVVRYHGIPPYPETRRFVARVLRKMGDKQGAERVMAKPIPAPVWTSRMPRPAPVVRMVGSSGAPQRATMVPMPSPRPERASHVVFQEGEAQLTTRTWTQPTPSPIAPVAPEPTAPLAQSP
ncbi:MAG TPA: lytic transglycosylase domain-containing protein [Methylomirabilota bacterium]|nr:lytic transglycosylase domain-containing protein [Methylomirabilota bacterium]